MLEIVCFDPFVLNLCELPPHDIELHPNPAEDISKNRFSRSHLRISGHLFYRRRRREDSGRARSGAGRNGASSRTLGGSDDLRNQCLLAIVTDCAIGLIGPFPTDANDALNGR
jgi:hypothetical protein